MDLWDHDVTHYQNSIIDANAFDNKETCSMWEGFVWKGVFA